MKGTIMPDLNTTAPILGNPPTGMIVSGDFLTVNGLTGTGTLWERVSND